MNFGFLACNAPYIESRQNWAAVYGGYLLASRVVDRRLPNFAQDQRTPAAIPFISARMARSKVSMHHICVECGRQFIDVYDPPKGYSDDVKRECLKMYVNGLGFRAIEPVKGVHHTTVILQGNTTQVFNYQILQRQARFQKWENLMNWKPLSEKKNKIWLWTATNHFTQGILAWVLGDRSAETFKPLWKIVQCWHSYFYVTDGYAVYPGFINREDQIVNKTYMTRVENENTRVRHYLARLHRKTLCYSKSEEMLRHSMRLLLHYLKYRSVPLPA